MIAGGWNLGIPKYSKHKEAAIRFLHFITSPEISLQITKSPDTSLDPYRLSHYQSSEFRSLWPTAGEYLDAINANLAAGYPDLLIPGSAEYMDKLDYALCQALAGEKAPKEALDDTARAWDEITDRLDREKQKAYWNAQYDAMKKQEIVFKVWKE
jgi:multiple sugar transport system substrate-binding protein